jgi:hypothetical protein
MKNRILASAFALAATIAGSGAMAQTGRPAEAPAPNVQGSVIDTTRDPAGSYARYLMLNGTPRAEAIRAAQAIDHPAPRKFAWHKEQREAGKAR